MIESDIYRMPNGKWGVTVREGFYRVHEHGFDTQEKAEEWRNRQVEVMRKRGKGTGAFEESA